MSKNKLNKLKTIASGILLLVIFFTTLQKSFSNNVEFDCKDFKLIQSLSDAAHWSESKPISNYSLSDASVFETEDSNENDDVNESTNSEIVEFFCFDFTHYFLQTKFIEHQAGRSEHSSIPLFVLFHSWKNHLA